MSSFAQPQSLKCDRCGAYLEVPADPNVHTVTCRYCNYAQLLPDVANRRAAQRSAQMAQQGMQLAQNAANTSRRIGAVGGLVGALVPLFIAGFVIYSLREQGVFGRVGPSWTGTGPLVCTGNDHVTVNAVTSMQPGMQVVIASGNCRLELTNVSITAATPVVASGNAHVIVVGGALISTGGVSVAASGNASVIVTGASVVGPVMHSGNATVMGVPGAM